jgi:hypothetical protein
MAGGELRLGTVSMYMGAIMHICHVQSSTNMLITWEHFHRGKFARRSNKSETYLRIWADFFWNFGLAARHIAMNEGYRHRPFAYC